MQKLTLIVLSLCCFILAGTANTWTQATYNISQYFPLGLDNTWIYRAIIVNEGEKSQEISVSSIQDRYASGGADIYVFELNLNEKPLFYYSEDKGEIYLHKMVEDEGYSVFSPALLIFSDQMQLNKENIFSGKGRSYNNKDELIDEYNIEIKSKFEGAEEVTVPAGKFQDCLKFTLFMSYYKRRGTMTVEQTIWLAKNTGKVKERNVITVYNGKPRQYHNFLELKKAIIMKK